ncbi:hypothetical protein FQR65_LT12173 [Abscondita terminalis]|nr:hypothetical protein FQR65_LT12173 [Abscondita terminalis]
MSENIFSEDTEEHSHLTKSTSSELTSIERNEKLPHSDSLNLVFSEDENFSEKPSILYESMRSSLTYTLPTSYKDEEKTEEKSTFTEYSFIRFPSESYASEYKMKEESPVVLTKCSCETLQSASIEEESNTLSLGPIEEGDINPFRVAWTFGVNTGVDVINLTNKSKSVVFYACSHVCVLYNYVEEKMSTLQGHVRIEMTMKNLISCIASDDSGRWIVTADKGEDNIIVVWDSFDCSPVNTIFDPYPDVGTAVCGISGNAKYLIAVGNELRPTVKFWLWTLGENNPNDSYVVENNYGIAKKVCFNPDVQEHIWVAFEKKVMFFKWAKKLSTPIFPILRNFKKYGFITDCTYFLHCHQCVASTTGGVLLVFGNTLYTREIEEGELANNKIYVKGIKVSNDSIDCVNSIDGLLVTGDIKGHIKFYDNRIRLLFWCQDFELSPIKSVSFNLEPRNYRIEDAVTTIYPKIELMEREIFEDRTDSIEILYSNLVPTDATLGTLPFVVRDFIVATDDGRIGGINFLENKISFFNKKIEANVTSMDAHDEQPFICMGLENGCLCLFNYLSKCLISKARLSTQNTTITYIKYSSMGLHLACGTERGRLYFLDPISLTLKSGPICFIKNNIKKIVFSADSRFCAYYSNKSTIAILKYSADDSRWDILGKIRSHNNDMTDILFNSYLPPRLFSIGSDKILQEYDLINSKDGEIVFIATERIEQNATPLSFMYVPSKQNVVPEYFYMCNDQYKYKTVNDSSFVCHRVVLGPAYGCYEKSPVNKIQMLPEHQNKYMLYANDKFFGIQIFPPDGNPHKYVGITGHPTELIHFCTSFDGKYAFTIGKNDSSMIMWEVNTEAVEISSRSGGFMIEPYYSLIEGGLDGWLFKEMQDLFYYMQILHQGENTVLPRNVSDYIPISELPDLMRAVGYYPSEYEVWTNFNFYYLESKIEFQIDNMLIDQKYRDYDETKSLRNDVSFLEFIQLYVNYRPAHGISIETLKQKFDLFCRTESTSDEETITRDGFVKIICEKGEVFTLNKAYTCLASLMREEDDNATRSFKNFSFLPPVIDFKTFLEDILGVDLEREMMVEEEAAKGDRDDELEC